MGQGGEPLGDRPEPVKPHCVHRQAPERGDDLHAVPLAVAVSVLPELGVAKSVPAILKTPAISHLLEQSPGAGAQPRDLVTGLIDWPAGSTALAARRHHRGAARPVLHHPLRCRHAPQCPGDAAAVADLAPAGLERRPSAVGQAIPDHLKPFAAAMFHGDHEVGGALGEVGEKGRFACSASACTSSPTPTEKAAPTSSTRSSS